MLSFSIWRLSFAPIFSWAEFSKTYFAEQDRCYNFDKYPNLKFDTFSSQFVIWLLKLAFQALALQYLIFMNKRNTYWWWSYCFFSQDLILLPLHEVIDFHYLILNLIIGDLLLLFKLLNDFFEHFILFFSFLQLKRYIVDFF